MVVPVVLPKVAAYWLFSCLRAARKLKTHGFFLPHKRSHQTSSLYSNVTKCPLEGRESQTLLCDFHGSLLISPSLFPFFMLVAFESGSLFRALILLLSSPIVFALGHHSELSLRVMTFIAFCGLRTRAMDLVARAVLPKFYLEDLHLHAYEVLISTGKRVVVTSLPRVMVEGFLKDYLGVTEVVGAELQVVNGSYFSGLTSVSHSFAKQRSLRELFGDTIADVALVGSSNPHDHLLIPHSKEVYIVSKEGGARLPRSRYPKPLVFHDGRLTFLPTPLNTLSLLLWLPYGIYLAIIRISIGLLLPYSTAFIVGALTGFRLRVGGLNPDTKNTCNKGVLYVCTHRTLLDPVMLASILSRPVPAVTYSLSRMSEILAPMPTVRLTRDRDRDAETIRRILAEGDLAVCPEGTTCREPYLLRFSPLFAELAEEMVPVAMEARSGMLYGTTASGLKWLDPVLFLTNPMPEYRVEFLGRVPREETCAGGLAAAEVANRIQRKLGDALGFECTGLTRKDKYLMLAGNEGVVRPHK